MLVMEQVGNLQEMLLRETFIRGLNDLGVFEKLNENNSYAIVKVAE